MLETHSKHRAILYSLIFTVVIISLSVHLTAYTFKYLAIDKSSLGTLSMGMALIVAPPCSYFMAVYTVKLIDLQEQLSRLANTDVLTGILNRRSFTSLVEIEQRRISRTHTPTALLLIDADHFKQINSRYGHCAGDEVLKNITTVMQDCLRGGTDFLARWGGEEFVIMLAETTLAQATCLGERLRAMIEEVDTNYKDQTISTTICVGVTYLRPDETLIDAVERADQCLSKAKRSGRNRSVASPPYVRHALVA